MIVWKLNSFMRKKKEANRTFNEIGFKFTKYCNDQGGIIKTIMAGFGRN